MTKLTTIFAALALVTTVACSKKDDNKKASNKNPAKNTPAKTDKTPDKKPDVKTDTKPATDKTADLAKKIKKYTPDELDKAKDGLAILDANGKTTRAKYGKIPSAILLTSGSRYEMSELPKDKSKGLVFYCSNDHCSASKRGAKRALLAGYTNVGVLPVGIKGWKEAGKKTTAVQ